jgi:hypothetical protein
MDELVDGNECERMNEDQSQGRGLTPALQSQREGLVEAGSPLDAGTRVLPDSQPCPPPHPGRKRAAPHQ